MCPHGSVLQSQAAAGVAPGQSGIKKRANVNAEYLKNPYLLLPA